MYYKMRSINGIRQLAEQRKYAEFAENYNCFTLCALRSRVLGTACSAVKMIFFIAQIRTYIISVYYSLNKKTLHLQMASCPYL